MSNYLESESKIHRTVKVGHLQVMSTELSVGFLRGPSTKVSHKRRQEIVNGPEGAIRERQLKHNKTNAKDFNPKILTFSRNFPKFHYF